MNSRRCFIAMVDAETLHRLAVAAGATVLGDPPHYLLDPDQLRAVIEAARVPPCPVPLPKILPDD